MMVGTRPGARQLARWLLPLQDPEGQRRQYFGGALPRHERGEQAAPRGPNRSETTRVSVI
jgi:hypothetical protein